MSRGRRPLVVHVVGARPNYMKVAPVYAELARRGHVDQRLVHTGQHYDAAVKDVFFAELPLPRPHVQLEVGSGSHGEQTARALAGLERVFADLRPDLVLVPGDVNSTLAGALAAVKLGIPVCHLESGLRSFDWTMPEEHNRRVADHLSSLHLVHSRGAEENLAREGIAGDHVVLVGNTMIDALAANLRRARRLAVWRRLGLRAGGYVLVTLHRPALVDDLKLLARTMTALGSVARELPIVFPVHPRTLARLRELGRAESERVLLLEPQPYRRFLSLEAGAAAVVTDSGGVQEETTALGVPCFTLRDNTERPVTVTDGTNTILGLEPERLTALPRLLAERPRERRVPALWDGRAGIRAAEAIERALAVAAEAGPAAAERGHALSASTPTPFAQPAR
ncbi:MAG TPA: UDP-N-acetylglucosamine 2-epimerase (non-hydrolyzing) [Gaiellaceae bacterium]|jgi:UDP-N-acetylglucosamine 2-epimerase (non-hydrolysing)|nr:UDP-N-acetylglucosamine 2-epimerase (non-hydrolyzing) [Gaiellaceae bacterium]